MVANLLVAKFGPSITILNAFLFVGLDLSSRDRLHDAWHGRYLWPKMLALIAVGSLLSYALSGAAGRIALASFVAFLAASICDAVVYAALGRRRRLVRMNGSNVASGAMDSILFPTLAFGAFLPLVVAGQFAAKVSGGTLWAWVLTRKEGAER